MPKYQIPISPGEFKIQNSKAGTLMIWNGKKSKGKVIIQCRDFVHTNEIMEKLKEMKNGGELWV